MAELIAEVYRRIERVAADAAEAGGLDARLLSHFLRTGDATWEGASSGQFTREQFHVDMAYSAAARSAMRALFASMGELLPEEDRTAAPLPAEFVVARIRPMIEGLLPPVWRETALREIAARLFILNYAGARAALEAERSSCGLDGSWRLFWLSFEDYQLKPPEIEIACEGMASDYAHVRWSSALQPTDPFHDVVVHEAAHMLHYLKPAHFGLTTRRGQERFLDVTFRHRELFAYSCEAYSRVVAVGGARSERVAFAETMLESATSFPEDEIAGIADLVLAAARARNGWRVIRDAATSK